MGSFGMKAVIRNWQLYAFVLPAVLYFVVFHYLPLYGVQIAFKNFVATQGIWGSKWVGFDHFETFFHSYYFWILIRNTVLISAYQLLLFPVPIIVALSLNELKNGLFKQLVQTVTYAPHFISVVVMSGMILAFLSPSAGIVNKLLGWVGFGPIGFLSEPGWFKTVYVFSGEWQSMGWGAIIYLAALAGVNPDLHEAATMDGANRLQRIWHINLPGIMPTIVILFILNMGSFMALGFEKILLLQNPLNMEASDVIQTYVYRNGLLQGRYSFSAAVGLFNSAINLVILVTANQVARRLNQASLW
ncbi:ABC transporter permease [Paenibacillus cymbidii]|uniref:ABC transporter permease n=1 Tax=Paenibacillus cymbidii TaxID=1639034 RepID=UPI0010820B9F|nr:ABC transporter permease subunit [Paenibacillus cymbidii]